VVVSVEMFQKSFGIGDKPETNVGILLRGLKKEDIERRSGSL